MISVTVTWVHINTCLWVWTFAISWSGWVGVCIAAIGEQKGVWSTFLIVKHFPSGRNIYRCTRNQTARTWGHWVSYGFYSQGALYPAGGEDAYDLFLALVPWDRVSGYIAQAVFEQVWDEAAVSRNQALVICWALCQVLWQKKTQSGPPGILYLRRQMIWVPK